VVGAVEVASSNAGGSLAGSNAVDIPPETISRALGTLAVQIRPDTPGANTSKALGPLAVAERHILGARYRSHRG
jgi:hypothetical protein